MVQKIARLDAHQRLLLALAVGVIAVVFTPEAWPWPARFVVVWIAFAGAVLALTWTTIVLSHPRELPRLSRIEDSSRVAIFVFVLGAVATSLGAVITLLGSLDDLPRPEKITHILLATAAVIASWLLVHTLFTLRYAHLFYGNDPKRTHPPGGLDFPGGHEPDYLDFAYFAFVVGMTSQTADVGISGRTIRRLVLVHGVLAFSFNTLIIALSINTLSGLI